jgi:nucleoside-diphosphate-sugar epimerase
MTRRSESDVRVLVTGGGGYIGSVLVPLLLETGHFVRAVDRFFFGEETLQSVAHHPKLDIAKDDIRWVSKERLTDIEAVIDLAALSNDPAGEIDPNRTMAINHQGRVRIARLAKEQGVKRYIFPSSCSIYGFRDPEALLDEHATPQPLTTYAQANRLAEEEILLLADRHFTVVILRLATVYGLSPRMRFDLAINGMTLGLFAKGKIPILRDGTQWRPFIHVQDAGRAMMAVLEAKAEQVNGERFNVGANAQNCQIYPLAQRVAEAVGVPFAFEWYGDPDHRSYRVNFDKLAKTLDFRPQFTPEDGAREIWNALQDGQISDGPKTRTVEWYKQLLQWNRVIQDVSYRGEIL